MNSYRSGTEDFYKWEQDKAFQHMEEHVSIEPPNPDGWWKIKLNELEDEGVESTRALLRRPRFRDECGRQGWTVKTSGMWVFFKKVSAFAGTAPNSQEEEIPVVVPQSVLQEDFFWYPPHEKMLVEKGILANFNMMLQGPTGCGKTEMAVRILQDKKIEPFRMNLNGEVSVDDFVGMMTLEQGATVFKYGILPQAMQQGRPLILDECDAAPPEILFILQSVLEGNPLVLTKHGGETIKPVEGFCVIATANTFGKGDDSSLYAGTNVLNEAFLDRFAMVIPMNYLPKKKEIQVLTKRLGLHEVIAKKIVEVADLARKAMNEGKLFSTFSTRKCLAWAKLLTLDVSLTDGFKVTVLSKIVDEDKKVLAEIYQRVVGETVKV